VYVDNDITITGTGGTDGPHKDGTFTETYIARNFTLALKTGWNAIYQKYEMTATFMGSIENPTSVTLTSTATVSLSNPALRWILDGYKAPPTIPPASSTLLSAGTWANGNITSSGGEQYFRFVATASTHYIHFGYGSLDDVWVEVYSSSGSLVGDRENLYSSNTSESWSGLTSGQTYYIRVWPWSSWDYGTYRISFNSSWSSPSWSIAPSMDIIPDSNMEKAKKNEMGVFGRDTLRQKLNRQ
jgi:hypothetical protein